MMFEIHQGKTFPALTVTIRKPDKSALDLAGASVTFAMSKWRNNVAVVEGAGSAPVPANGQAVYQWQDGDTDTPGYYRGVFSITFADTRVGGFPNTEEVIDIHILPAIV